MTGMKPTRRSLIRLLAASSAAACTPCLADSGTCEWQGTALGADARILLLGLGRAAAEETVRACLAEIERLERIFSLHREDSEITRLNRGGKLRPASLDMTLLLRQCKLLHRLTGGLFDPTVQPLWRGYAEWYAGRPDRAPLPGGAVASLIGRIGLHRAHIDADAVRLAEGTELTLNGIAQGYIADRVADLLRRRGLSHVLLDLGEVRALDRQLDGRPFEIAIRESGLRLEIANTALATSAADALSFAPAQALCHILNPETGLTSSPWRCVTVQHPSATVADGLSTALVLADQGAVRRIVGRIPNTRVWATGPDGAAATFG